jgi:hypothetical protein
MRVSFLSDPHEAFILNNSAQPCRKASITLKLFPVLKCFPKGALNCVFGITQVVHYQRCPLHARAPMTLNEFVESIDICVPYKRRRLLAVWSAGYQRGMIWFDRRDPRRGDRDAKPWSVNGMNEFCGARHSLRLQRTHARNNWLIHWLLTWIPKSIVRCSDAKPGLC